MYFLDLALPGSWGKTQVYDLGTSLVHCTLPGAENFVDGVSLDPWGLWGTNWVGQFSPFNSSLQQYNNTLVLM